MKFWFDSKNIFENNGYSHVNIGPGKRGRQPLGSHYFHKHMFFFLFLVMCCKFNLLNIL